MPRATKPAPDPTRAVAYLRCSTERQDLSPDAQRAAVEGWAAGAGVTVLAWHEDRGISGGAPLEDRPGLTAALADLGTRGAGVLVVARRDRLARDVLTAALVERLCERAGARLLAADGTGNGDSPEAALLRTMVDAFAAYERALIRARTRSALAVKKARGERVGTVPYGWRAGADGRLVADPVEAAAVVRARELRAEGRPLRAVAAALVEEGHRPRNGGAWAIQTLRRITRVFPEPTGSRRR
jgi:DNA invertase Pin-like site-specific DNA recombinase